jgi:predicted permease
LPHLVKAIAVILILFALAVLLRQRGVLNETQSPILAQTVTHLFLPASVFDTGEHMD